MEPFIQRIENVPYSYRPFGIFRLLLAALVMLQHFAADFAPVPLARALAPYGMGNMAVLVFFALSGFVICEAADSVYPGRPGAFLSNRLLRILPHFVVAVALGMLAHELFRLCGGVRLWRSQPDFPRDAFGLGNVAFNFLGVLPLADRLMSYNFLDITWAVRVEMAFYLVVFVCLGVASARGGAIRLPRVLLGAALLLAPLFVLAMRGRGIGMLSYLPYFVFGGGLYYAATGRRGGWIVALVSLPALAWHAATLNISNPSFPEARVSVVGNGILLAVLMGALVVLALVRDPPGQAADAAAGRLTYPLYLYHQDVLVLMLTFTTGYSYAGFVFGMLASLVASVLLAGLIDPAVDKLRDRVRGRSVRVSRAGDRTSNCPAAALGHDGR